MDDSGRARAVVLRLVDAWNAHDLAAVSECLHEDFENHQLPLGVTVGREAYLRHLTAWFDAYPDLHVTVRSCFGLGTLVCLETVESGVRTGRMGGAPPSRRRESFFGCDVFEVHDGRVAIQRGYWDYSVGTGLLAPRAGGHGPDGSRYFRPEDPPS